jgi:Ribbon-helix-helix domain
VATLVSLYSSRFSHERLCAPSLLPKATIQSLAPITMHRPRGESTLRRHRRRLPRFATLRNPPASDLLIPRATRGVHLQAVRGVRAVCSTDLSSHELSNIESYYLVRIHPTVAAKSYRQVACVLTPEQHDGLKRLSKETHIPMQVFLRKAVDDALARYGIRGKCANDDFLDRGLINLRKGTNR